MKRIVWTFGLLAGGIIAALTGVTLPLCMNGTLQIEHAEVLGYTIMVLAFALVFFAIRSYRETVGGTISFGKAFQVGILTALVACAVYVVVWEVVYYAFLPDFADKYAARVIAGMKAKGASDAAILKTTADMARFKELYRNPLFNVGMTFIEVFPVALVVTLVSAAILRRRTPPTVLTASAPG